MASIGALPLLLITTATDYSAKKGKGTGLVLAGDLMVVGSAWPRRLNRGCARDARVGQPATLVVHT